MRIYGVGSPDQRSLVRRHGTRLFCPLKRAEPTTIGLSEGTTVCFEVVRFWRSHIAFDPPAFIPTASPPAVGVLVKLAYRTRLVYEAHELETEVKTAKGVRRTLLRALERSLISFADEVVVVSERIADWYEKEYRIARPDVVRNIPKAGTLSGESFGLRRRLQLPDDARVALNLGAVAPGRRVEWVIERWKSVPGNWHFVVVGDGPSLASCRQFAATYRTSTFTHT